MAIIGFVRPFITGENNLIGVNHDNIVATIHVRRVAWQMLASQPRGNNAASNPTTIFSASINTHFLSISAGLERFSSFDPVSRALRVASSFIKPDAKCNEKQMNIFV